MEVEIVEGGSRIRRGGEIRRREGREGGIRVQVKLEGGLQYKEGGRRKKRRGRSKRRSKKRGNVLVLVVIVVAIVNVVVSKRGGGGGGDIMILVLFHRAISGYYRSLKSSR